jgi:acylphosphatase
MEKRIRVHIFVSGRVQGVFFRHFTKSNAQELGVCGWVKNLPDGRVEAVFEGEETKVKRLLKLVKKGPPLSYVKKVELSFEEPKNEDSGFEIR